VPVRTFDGWDDPSPGFVEADLIGHSGPVTKGSFVQTLVLTDIANGWTECAPLLCAESLIEVVGIFVTAADGEDASAQNVRQRVNNACPIAPIGDLRSKPLSNRHAPLRQSLHHAVVGTDATTVDCRMRR
jgi:hypothetical protein